MRALWAGWLVLALATFSAAGEPAGKLIRESWDAAFLDGEKSGHIRTTVVEFKGKDQTVLRFTRELRLSVKRFEQIAKIQVDVGNDETPDGKLLGFFMTQNLGTDQKIKHIGRVEDGAMLSRIDDPRIPPDKQVRRKIELPDELLTYLTEESLLKQRKSKPGDRISYRLFEPTVNNVIQVDVEVKGYAEVPLDGVNRKLLRVVARPEKIQGVQLPSQTIWYDSDFNVVVTEGEIPGLGELTLQRTSKEKALAPLGKLRDLGDQSVALDRPIAGIHGAKRITYRVVFAKEVEDMDKSFATNGTRQKIQNIEGKNLELVVAAERTPPKESNALAPREYLKSNFFINSTDELVQKHAENAVGEQNDPWRKAQAIERWVKRNMKAIGFSEAMATADHVAKTLTGDCTEFAMLTAAMCRAQDIPSRTAIGVVYYNDSGKAKLGYHMWTEVWVNGEWLALDATMGLGSVGPGHVKITDHHWNDVRSMTPLLPVMRVMMGRPRMEVVKVEK